MCGEGMEVGKFYRRTEELACLDFIQLIKITKLTFTFRVISIKRKDLINSGYLTYHIGEIVEWDLQDVGHFEETCIKELYK